MSAPTPEEIQAFLASLGDDKMAQDLQTQLDSARALREYQPAPFTSAGGVTVANVPGAIAGMFVRGKGERQAREAQAQQAAMAEKQRKIAAEYFNKVFGQQTPAGPSPMYGPQPFKEGGLL